MVIEYLGNTRIKILSNLDISEKRVPQDGRFDAMKPNGVPIECRVSTCPTTYGEKIVIRLLDSNNQLFDVRTLGLNDEQYQLFIEAIHQPYGLIIVTGPTGSGKTLVALLIAEWRRRKYKEKILYLCPTNQLVSQVCKQAKTYGIDVVSFTGKKENYQQSDLNQFITSEAIAVTNYSSLFNINPQFKNADIIFCDDAHSADQYISSMWTLNISKSDDKEAFDQIINIIKNSLSESSQSVLTNTNNSYRDVDHLPIPYLYGYEEELTQYLDSYCEGKKPLRFSWNTIREHLSTCLFFYSSDSIQIKPLISPTWTHKPFTEAKQRVYISATLSLGGDLERCFGITECESLSHEDYTESGVGRHLFMFPQMLKTTEDQESLEISLI
ncbi:MAG: DEAD/DEAH box helicase, partial [Alphaproteobacteria bacterium]|nr:DEAD/DEAH box helicase [Alphaproteobacteria bacterium]